MNRWVLLEHKTFDSNLVNMHYDLLVEDELECITWKLYKIPTFYEGFFEIEKQPNHRLVWLSRVEHKLSKNRGLVKRIDRGTFSNISHKLDSQEIIIKFDGKLLNGVLRIYGNVCQLTKK